MEPYQLHTVKWSVGAAAVFLVASGGAACGTGSTAGVTNMVSPTAAIERQPAGSMSVAGVAHPVVGIALVGGRFTMSTSTVDFVEGNYTGSVSTAGSPPFQASIEITVAGGGGQFAGASGSLQGTGSGAFAGEGPFELSLKGAISRPGRSNDAPFRVDFHGTSLVACVAGQIQVTMQGAAPGTKLGAVSFVLQHTVSGGNCGP
jgi:hypothetical protein